MRRTLSHAAVLILVSFNAYSVRAESAVEDVWSECRADNTCTIEYDHLANQETDPFLFSGKVVDGNSNKWRSHKSDIREFSDVYDCLVSSERGKKEPNLLLIDWDKVGFGHAAEICLFRISRSLGNTRRLKEWLDYQGFKVVGLNRSRSESYKPRYETQPMQTLSAKWSGAVYEAQYAARKGPLFHVFAHFYGIGGFIFNMGLSEDGSVVSIEANWTGKH